MSYRDCGIDICVEKIHGPGAMYGYITLGQGEMSMH